MGRGCTVLPSVDRNTVGGAGTGGLMTSCRGFLFAHRKTPEEQERGEERREEKTSGGVTAGANKQTHTCMIEREREGEEQTESRRTRVGWMLRGGVGKKIRVEKSEKS